MHRGGSQYMTKVRVHEVAKSLDKTNKEVIDFLRENNVEVSSHMSSLTDEQIEMVKGKFAPAAKPVFTSFSVQNSPLTVFPAFVSKLINDNALFNFNCIKLLFQFFVYFFWNGLFE